MRAAIICGGDVGEYIKRYIREDDFVICADSGLDRARKFGIIPDVVLGDMDSVRSDDIPEDSIIYPCRKDFTDSELAVGYALEKGFKNAVLFGMVGCRADHSLANLTLLPRFDSACIINSHNEIYFLKNKIELAGKPGDIVSVIPYPTDAVGISNSGLEYPLCDDVISVGSTRGISNVMTGNKCEITLKSGSAFVIRSRD